LKRTLNLKKLSRHLLATTCLTFFAGVAGATTTFTESTDFPNSAPGTTLPVGTTEVVGTLTIGSDVSDWFIFTGLLPGAPFTVAASDNIGADQIDVYDPSNTSSPLTGFFFFGVSPNTGTGTVPADGQLEAHVYLSSSEVSNNTYTIDLTASLAPEPGTVWTLASGFAGALVLRRRRK
jgi:hypothetical protein